MEDIKEQDEKLEEEAAVEKDEDTDVDDDVDDKENDKDDDEEEQEEDEDEDESEDFILSPEELEDLEESLAEIGIDKPDHRRPSLGALLFPPSYKENSTKEKMLLQLAENFYRQYKHLYPDREPLFMSPVNECGVEKFVSTTLRPTLLPYPELYAWEECATFLAQYLTAQFLHPPIEPPKHLYSPSTILKMQRGNCFDFSILLCSFLLGAGFDAYCVSGYATKEMCLMDESTEDCPQLKKPEETSVHSKKKTLKKYSVKPPRDLSSKFELAQEAKKEAKLQAALEKSKKEAEEMNAETEKTERDPLYGLRIHCWVLVLSGKREVPENFFIDSFTGLPYNTTDDHFLGIESLWNHQNYWVNMQDCREGCKDLIFDLGDPVRWEFMLLGTGKPLLSIPDMEEEEEPAGDETDDMEKEQAIFNMPPSWVEPITVSPKEFETRSPEGKKVVHYKKSRLEKWAPYLMEDGLVSRLTVYQDAECTQELEVKEWYTNRQDKLEMKEINRKTGTTTDYFAPGRSESLRVHVYKSMMPETDRTMLFYNEARVDGLKKREEKPLEMTELFEERADFLCYRHIIFGKRPKKVAIAGTPVEANPRPIQKITERFHRNRNKLANDDVAERIFLILQERFQLTYHRDDDHITSSKWEFSKPAHLGEKGTHVTLTPETSIYYQVEPIEKWNKQLYVYEMLTQLLEAENMSKDKVRHSEAEVLEILSMRSQEVIDSQLTISNYDTERNENSKKQREAMEAAQQEERIRQAALELDYLAPFLAKIGDPEKLTKWQAAKVKEDSLSDLKQRLIDKANLMQARFEKETQELQKKQQWYHQNQMSMSQEDEEAYLAFCSEAMFRIHILEFRLAKHKENAPMKYLALEDKLNKDPRLFEHLLSA
ncbi:dynein regulatory complex subunit 7 [Ambystoma mexicanum]|uniref:dynein regulatory complex subunit 7 n=1 Tax=Ambystoma mexicanum TaxID=8296 RepID=UPI0037E7C19A